MTSVFLCYSHAPKDKERVDTLEAFLKKEEIEVFRDVRMTVGDDWRRTIQDQLETADHVIVLLSQAAAASPFVQREVRVSGERRRASDVPRILPIFLEEVDLWTDYELGTYLQPTVPGRWLSSEDTDRVLQEVLHWLRGSSEEHVIGTEEAGTEPPERFSAKDDNGLVPFDSPFYVKRESDYLVERQIQGKGTSATTVVGPYRMGKGSLIYRMRNIARFSGYRCSLIDMGTLDAESRTSLRSLTLAWAREIHNELKFGPPPDNLWQSKLTPSTQFSSFVEQLLLRDDENRAVLFLENADYVLPFDFADDFFNLLRHLANRGADRPEWRRFHLVQSVSLAPHLYIEKADSSAFNVGNFVELKELQEKQTLWLSRRHEPSLQGEDEVRRLHRWTGGHPYLTRRALFWISKNGCTVEEFERLSAEPRGPYRELVDWLMARLEGSGDLEESLLEVLTTGRCSNRSNFRRLSAAGLVKGSHRKGAEPRCPAIGALLKKAL